MFLKFTFLFLLSIALLSPNQLLGQAFHLEDPVQRHLGWIIKDGDESPVILTEHGSKASIQIILSKNRVGDLSSEVSGWGFFAGDMTIKLEVTSANINSQQNLLFTAERKDNLKFSAFAFRIRGDFYIFKVKPGTAGLSDREQFLFDELSNIPAFELAAYEGHNQSCLALVRPITVVTIQNLKRQLSDLGIKMQWKGEEQGYIISKN